VATGDSSTKSKFAEAGADLALVNVSKRFPGFTAIDDLSLEIPAGSFFALLGPSGCGKTTTLRLVAGLEEPTEGKILIGGKDVTSTRAFERPVNTVFQSYALFPHMTILENVAFGLKRRGIPNALELAREGLALVELAHIANRKPQQLSGGQQQRVALARAVVNRPALLLLDEPLGALDLKLRRQMQLELKSIQSDVGLTFLHVTHDQEEAMTMADTVAVMNQGRIEQMGAPEELYELPATAFVATFLGQSNLWQGEVTGSANGAVEVSVAGHQMRVPMDRSVIHRGRVTVGIRPEKTMLHQSKPDLDSAHTIVGPGRVIDASFSGVSTQYVVDIPGLGEATVFSQNTSLGDHARAGDEVFLSWQNDHAFGLADAPPAEERFSPDSDTGSIALAERERIEAELEEA
jgi:spermidine/putrescine transport system ATP-binding protein